MPSEARHPRDGAGQRPRSTGPRPVHAWNVLDRDQRLAAVAAVLLFATMLLPWYQQNAVVSAAKSQPLVSRNLNAFAVFSFVEAAVLLVAIAVLVLLYQRAEGRDFQLPGGDGAVVFAAGIWTALLLVLRLFDKPGIAHNGVAANIGVQWGIFFALGAASLLAYVGSRMRAARRPDPPLLRGDAHTRRGRGQGASTFDPSEDATGRARPPAADPSEDATIRERRLAGHPSEDPTALTPRPRTSTATPAAARERLPAETPLDRAEETPPQPVEDPPHERPPYPPPPPARPRARSSVPANAEQLSFEEPPAPAE